MKTRRYIFFLMLWAAGLAGCGTKSTQPSENLASAVAQDTAQQPWPAPPPDMELHHFTTDDGLCSNGITCLFQDSRGFLWIGTSDGLNRYDGYEFRQYRHEPGNANTLADNGILDIKEGEGGLLWVLTSNGLSSIYPESGKIDSYWDTSAKDKIYSLYASMVIWNNHTIFFHGKNIAFDIEKKQFFSPHWLSPEGEHRFVRRNDGAVFFVKHIPRPPADSLDNRPKSNAFVFRLQENGEPQPVFDTVETTYSLLGGRAWGSDNEGNLWFGNVSPEGGGLGRLNPKTKTYTLFSPDRSPGADRMRSLGGSVLGIAASKRAGKYWVASLGGLMLFEPGTDSLYWVIRWTNSDKNPKGLPARVVRSVLEDRTGNLWVGMGETGLCRYSPAQNKFEKFRFTISDSTTLASNVIESLFFDNQDRLWAGTQKGLSLLTDRSAKKFKTFLQTPVPGTQSNYNWIKGICENPQRRKLYLCYWGLKPNQFDLNTRRFEPLSLNGASKKLMNTLPWGQFDQNISPDGKGSFYYGVFSGNGPLNRYTPATGEFVSYCAGNNAAEREGAKTKGMLSSLSSVAFADRQGSVWLGNTEEKGIQRLDLNNGSTLGYICPECLKIPYEPKCKIGQVGAFTNFLPDKKDSTKLQHGQANTFFEDSKGRLWVGTPAGLHLMKDREKGIFKCYGKAAGFGNEYINSILEDGRGRLWVSTNKGISCFDPETGRVAAQYDKGDGLQGNDFKTNCAAKNARGLMAFGGANGFNIFHPDSIFPNTQVPTVELTNFEVNGTTHPAPKQGVALFYFEKNLSFDFSVMDFSNPLENLYQYRLEGYDDSLCAPTPNHQARYTNLPPGRYTLRVRGCNNDGVWSRNDLVFSVTIHAPWWATWWFYLLLGLAVVAAARYFIQRREARLRQKLRDDERLIRYLQVQTLQAQMNPHFIFNVLGVMQHQILKSNPQEANRHLSKLSTLIRRFLDSSVSSAPAGKGTTQNDIPLEEELELLTMYAEFEVLQREEKFEGKGFDIEVAESVNVSTMRIPPMIIQPYIENAVKHGIRYLPEGRKGFVNIRFSKEGDVLRCVVEDNGVGRTEAARIQAQSHSIYKSHGTRLVKERTEILNQMGYDIHIEPEGRPGGGTIVTINIKD